MSKKKEIKLSSAENEIIKDILHFPELISELLVDKWYFTKEFLEKIKEIEEKINTFPFSVSDIKEIKKLRDEYVGYSVYTSLQHTHKNMLRAILKEANSNTWLHYKTQAQRMADGSELLKTDTFVNKEVENKMHNLFKIEAFIIDLEARIKGLNDALKNINILLNSKIKHYEEEELTIASYSGESGI